MERLFAGEVYEIVAQPNGVVFSYCKDVIDDRVIVGYKMFSFENKTVTDVAKNIYQLSKFGSNYRAVAQLCNNYITARSIVLPTGRVFMIEDNGKASLFDDEGLPVWMGEMLYRGNPPSDVVFYKNALWASYPAANVLLRFSVATMREELRIGGASSPFDHPNDLFISGDEVIVSNTGSNKLVKLNLNSFNVHDYKEFSEPVYSYISVKNREFVLMKSGIYEL